MVLRKHCCAKYFASRLCTSGLVEISCGFASHCELQDYFKIGGGGPGFANCPLIPRGEATGFSLACPAQPRKTVTVEKLLELFLQGHGRYLCRAAYRGRGPSRLARCRRFSEQASEEAAIAAVPVHLGTPSGETGHPIRFPYTARSRKPLRSHKVAFITLWLSNCPSFRVATLSPGDRP